MTDDERWGWVGISGTCIQEKAAWLREKRNLHGRSLLFFETAGSILFHARTDYLLISAVFFHAVIGVESALKLHYKCEEAYMKDLLQRAVQDGLVKDSMFSYIAPLPDKIVHPEIRKLGTHHEKLVELIPKWRNAYVHGGYTLMPDYFHLTVQMREIADVLTTLPRG